jgi:hypothetical protein
LAYLAARHPTEAAAEFQRILDHRSIVLERAPSTTPTCVSGRGGQGLDAKAVSPHSRALRLTSQGLRP